MVGKLQSIVLPFKGFIVVKDYSNKKADITNVLMKICINTL